MTLLNAPQYDAQGERRRTGLLIAAGVVVLLAAVIGVGGYLLGHGWFYTNLKAEHKVSSFFDALEAKDYDKAYAIWMNDPDWKQHPQKYDYTLKRFTEDWTTESPVIGPIVSHKVDISKTDGSGTFGTGIIVAVRVNGDHKLFMWYQKSDGTLTYPAPHELQYD
jgi:hypothetical protein